MCGTCSSGETSQKSQLCGSLPSQGSGPQSHTGNHQTLSRSDLGGYMESGRSRLHIHSKQHVQMPTGRVLDRERDSISKNDQGPQSGQVEADCSQP